MANRNGVVSFNGISREAVLDMSQAERQQVVRDRETASRLGLVFVDGVGGICQFVGDHDEHHERGFVARNMAPHFGAHWG